MKTINNLKTVSLSLVLLALQARCSPHEPPVVDKTAPSPVAQSGTSGSPCPAAIGSPHGYVSFGEKVCSPDGKWSAKEVEPKNQGNIGIFDLATGNKVKVLKVTPHPANHTNDLKGLAWSPDSKSLAVMFHHDGGGHISVVSVDKGEEKLLRIKNWYRHIAFSSDGTKIIADEDSIEIR